MIDKRTSDALVANLVDTGEECIERPELGEQLGGRLLSHRWDPGDVVRRVPDEREEVDDLLWKHAVLGADALAVQAQGRVPCAAAAWAQERDPLSDDLRHVLVGSRDETRQPGLRRAERERGEHVVSLDSLFREDRDPQRAEQFDDQRQLRREVLRHRLPRCLVVPVELVPERHATGIEHRRDIRGWVIAQSPEDRAPEPE